MVTCNEGVLTEEFVKVIYSIPGDNSSSLYERCDGFIKEGAQVSLCFDYLKHVIVYLSYFYLFIDL